LHYLLRPQQISTLMVNMGVQPSKPSSSASYFNITPYVSHST